MRVPLGEWLPDLPELENPGATEALNVYPAPVGYSSVGDLSPFTVSVSATVVGAISVKDDGGIPYTYVGTASDIYEYSSTLSSTTSITRIWVPLTRGVTAADLSASGSSSGLVIVSTATDLSIFQPNETVRMYGWSASASLDGSWTISATGVSATKLPLVEGGPTETASRSVTIRVDYGLGNETRWKFLRYKNLIAAFGYETWPQYHTIGAATVMKTLTTEVRARHAAVVRDHIVVGDTFDPTDGAVPYRVRWCGTGQPFAWTVSSVTLADYQDLAGSSGQVRGLAGGEFGLVFAEKSVHRMTYAGAPLVFQFDEIAPGLGCAAGGSVIQAGDVTFFLSQNGFRAIAGGAQVVPIGSNKIDRWFFPRIDNSRLDTIQGMADIVNSRAIWAVTLEASSVAPDTLIVYDWSTNKWSRIDLDVEALFMWWSGGITLEEIDLLYPSIDAVPYSLDSRIWNVGVLQPAYFTPDHRLSLHGATVLPGTVETAEGQLFPPMRAHVRRIRPLVEGDASGSVQIGSRNRQADPVVWSTASAINGVGDCPVRNNARYQRVRVNATGVWTKITGVDVDAVAEGSGR